MERKSVNTLKKYISWLDDMFNKYFFRFSFILIYFLVLFLGSSTIRSIPKFYLTVLAWDSIRYYIPFILLTICFITKKFSKTELIYYSAFILFTILHWQVTGFFRWEPFYFLSMAILVKDESDVWLGAQLFWVQLINFSLILTLNTFDIIHSINVVRPDGTYRDSLGFWHPNQTGAMVLMILLSYLYMKKNLVSLITLFTFPIFYLFLDKFLDSRTGFLIICFIIFGILNFKMCEKFTIKWNKIKCTFEKNLLLILPVFFMLFSFFISYFFDRENNFFSTLNHVLSGRVDLGHFYINEYSINFWGQEILENSGNPTHIAEIGYRHLDNGFLHSLLRFGIGQTILRLIYLTWFGYRMKINGYKFILIIMVSILLFGFMERLIWTPFLNTFFLFGGILLKQQVNLKKNE